MQSLLRLHSGQRRRQWLHKLPLQNVQIKPVIVAQAVTAFNDLLEMHTHTNTANDHMKAAKGSVLVT